VDVLGEHADSGNESDGANFMKKPNQGEAEAEKDSSLLFAFYDFRRGSKHWPRGAEMISEDRGKELVDAAIEESNKKEDKSKTASAGCVFHLFV